MPALVPAEGRHLDDILIATYDIWHEGLGRDAYARFWAAQCATPFGRARLSRWALVDGADVQASAKLYTFDATLEGRLIRVAGIGAVFTLPVYRGHGVARELLARLLDRATAAGADVALLFSEVGPDYYARVGFAPIATSDLRIRVIEAERRGAPMTMVRGGEERDLPAIVEMGKSRAAPFRFHLNRDRDLLHYAISKKRLLAGLGPSGTRELHFFVAEEGASAVAYVVISMNRSTGEVAWVLEECGDRDPAERRPMIHGWLPASFRPQQLEIVREFASRDVMMVTPLTAAGQDVTKLRANEILYWRSDAF